MNNLIDIHHLLLLRSIRNALYAPRSTDALSVGSVAYYNFNNIIDTYSRMDSQYSHAEESLFKRLESDKKYNIYLSIEPCSKRVHAERTCVSLIESNKESIQNLYIASREPLIFVKENKSIERLKDIINVVYLYMKDISRYSSKIATRYL